MANGYVKLHRKKEVLNLLQERHTAFCLLTLIAYRAKRTGERTFNKLEVGEAFIGDFKSYGVSRQVYRGDVDFLCTWGFLTIKTTNKGTIAKLIDTSIYDINSPTDQPSKQPTANHQATTNKNDKNDKKEKEIYKEKETSKFTKELQEVIVPYWNKRFKHMAVRKTVTIEKNYAYWRTIYTLEEILQAIKHKIHIRKRDEFLFKIPLETLFRTKNKAGECNYLEPLINYTMSDMDEEQEKVFN